jgi:hypothetical protein
MGGFFFLEGAKEAMGISGCVESCLKRSCKGYQSLEGGPGLRVLENEPETWWHKLDHLIYLPILGLVRPRALYYYQGKGLKVLYDFTYKYLTLEHFLGELRRLKVGYALAGELSFRYSQAWYPDYSDKGQDDLLFIFSDWHVKPHWTKHKAHSGHVSMLERFMPGTHQLMINGPEGHILGGWNYPIDTHLSHVLVDLESDLASNLERPIAYNIFDSEGSGLPTAERYAEAKRFYISVLPRKVAHGLGNFKLLDDWELVEGDEGHEVVEARWQDPKKAQADPRRLILMRRLGDSDPVRIYAGCIPPHLSAGAVPGRYRQRWQYQERVIRQLVNGANLNANFGYSFREVENRTQKRRWEEAQKKVEATEERLSLHLEALRNLWKKLKSLRKTFSEKQTASQQQIDVHRRELHHRQESGQPWRRCQQRLQKCERDLAEQETRFQKQRSRLLNEIGKRRQRRSQFQKELRERQQLRDGIDTDTLCRERDAMGLIPIPCAGNETLRKIKSCSIYNFY